AARLLHRTDAVERHAGAADERTPRLEDQRDAVRQPLDERANELRNRRQLLVAVVSDAEASAEIEDARRPGQALEEREHALECKHAFVRPGELRADVDVHALDLEAELARPLDLALGGVRGQAELRFLVRGLDRAMRHRLHARRKAYEHAPDARGRSLLRLARRIEDDERARRRRGAELLLRLVVAVADDPLPRDSGRAREPELAERRDVRTDAFLGEQPQQRDVGE